MNISISDLVAQKFEINNPGTLNKSINIADIVFNFLFEKVFFDLKNKNVN